MKGNRSKTKITTCPNCKEEFLARSRNQACCTMQCKTIYENKKLNEKWAENKPKSKYKNGFKENPLGPSSNRGRYE